ncbi:Jasmonate O-methyltransferase [Acorus gramineus]|uniref:Jasmonate O-methyltransferase n=1 Tax=Acorus gramineus TaxID=55184 RepID=A0AAV9AVA9_ACOGR|nr:Jasmonate O-methyltransferase [Acorus gramineus]
MKEGDDATSYAKNSVIQKNIILASREIVKEAILDLYCSKFPERLNIAEMGCSTGPNAMLAISEVMNAIDQKRRELGIGPVQFQCFLNDLPWNDFNTIFKELPEFHDKRLDKDLKGSSCFVAGVPGTFYGRLFPNKSIDFVVSSSSLHWLSQVPRGLESGAEVHLNKGKINISKKSPPCVLSYYSEQFHKDFSTFVKSRSKEIVTGGRMVLTIIGRKVDDPTEEDNCFQWDCMANALMDLVSEGLLDEERIDSYNIPFYPSSLTEVMNVIRGDGTFTVDRLEIVEVEGPPTVGTDGVRKGDQWAMNLRAVLEPIFIDHFGRETSMDDLFSRAAYHFNEFFSRRNPKFTCFVVSLVRNDQKSSDF